MKEMFQLFTKKYSKFDEKIQMNTFLVYYELLNSHDLSVFEHPKIERYYIEAIKKRNQEKTIVIPYSVHEKVSFEHLSNLFFEKSVTLALIDSDSTIVFYQIKLH